MTPHPPHLRHHMTLWPYWQCLLCGAEHYLADRLPHAPGCEAAAQSEPEVKDDDHA